MKEEFLQYIWQHQLFDAEKLRCASGEKIEVLHPGIPNRNAGPDFFNAKIKIGDTLWAGNVEIHLKSSDWEKHKHDKDPAYDNVILHVVGDNDKAVYNTVHKQIPTSELYYSPGLYQKYDSLLQSPESIPCADKLPKIDPWVIRRQLTRVLPERLERKTGELKTLLTYTENHWENTFYIAMAKAFGFKINAVPFELLAKSLSLQILAKHKNNLRQLEALLFGQAGMLEDQEVHDDYFLDLQKEYKFLQHKYRLQPLKKHIWKFMRIRPVNFPTVRLAQFAALIARSSHLFSKILLLEDMKTLHNLLSVSAGSYWDTHYIFGKESKSRKKSLGKSAINNIAINTLVPVYFLYGKEKDNETYIEKSLDLLEQLEAEKNHIVNLWESTGVEVKTAFDSQALLELYSSYCHPKRCISCSIGNKVIRATKNKANDSSLKGIS